MKDEYFGQLLDPVCYLKLNLGLSVRRLEVVEKLAVVLVPSRVYFTLLVYLQQHVKELLVSLLEILGGAIARVATNRLQLAKKEVRDFVKLLVLHAIRG